MLIIIQMFFLFFFFNRPVSFLFFFFLQLYGHYYCHGIDEELNSMKYLPQELKHNEHSTQKTTQTAAVLNWIYQRSATMS